MSGHRVINQEDCQTKCDWKCSHAFMSRPLRPVKVNLSRMIKSPFSHNDYAVYVTKTIQSQHKVAGGVRLVRQAADKHALLDKMKTSARARP